MIPDETTLECCKCGVYNFQDGFIIKGEIYCEKCKPKKERRFKIHYKVNNHYLCNKWLEVFDKTSTEQFNKVTCKSCIKQIKIVEANIG